MARYQAILAYDGTEFSGFQRQAGARTVQAEVEAALKRIGWTGRTIYAAGRTDAGVHASGQVVAFDLHWGHSPLDLQHALNANLPPDTAVWSVEPAGEAFHPRYAAKARRYEYRIYYAPERDPLQDRYACRLWPIMDSEILYLCAEQFIGTHDFSAYGTPPRAGGPTIRRVERSEWSFREMGARYTIEANAFLFRMARRIVQMQVDVALGRVPIEAIGASLSGETPEMVQGLAPAGGLMLAAVRY